MSVGRNDSPYQAVSAGREDCRRREEGVNVARIDAHLQSYACRPRRQQVELAQLRDDGLAEHKANS